MTPPNEQPAISISTTCYNHEKYIPFFMESLLQQDFTNWELVVTDDCSTDDSYRLLQSYTSDPRIRVYKNDRNRHVCHTFNHSLSKVNGEYVCCMSVDDGLVKGKLAHDYEFLEHHQNVSVLYNDLIPIGEDNEPIDFSIDVHEKMDRWDVLRFLFTEGNCLPVPGMMIRRECVDQVGKLNPLLRLTQDYEWHIRLLLNSDMAQSETPLTYYRRRENRGNLSAWTVENFSAIYSEMELMLKDCVKKIADVQQFRKIFPEFTRYENMVDRDIPFYAGLVLVGSPVPSIRAAGLSLLYDFALQNGDYLEKSYDFLAKDFMKITQESKIAGHYVIFDPPILRGPMEKIMYKIWRSLSRKLRRRGYFKGIVAYHISAQ